MIRGELIVEINGKEVYRGDSKSLVQNFGKALLAIISSIGSPVCSTNGVISSSTIVDLNNATASFFGEFYSTDSRGGSGGGVSLAMNAPDNDDSYGIAVGSGSTPVTPNDYNLASKIPHGTGPGQLDYEPHTINSSYSDTYSYVEIARGFINRSGGDVIVREVGLIAWNYWRNPGGVVNSVKFLIARDVLPDPILIPNLASLTVRYRISLSL